MTSKIILVALLCLVAASASALDIAAYEIVHEDKRADGPFGENYMCILQFRDSRARVPLMREAPSGEAIDMATLRTTWLIKDNILWVHWNTRPELGSGGYTSGGHVLVLISEGKTRELLRECFSTWGKQGVGNYQSTAVAFSPNDTNIDGRPTVKRTVSYSDSRRDFERAVPLSVKSEDSWIRQFKIVEETFYLLTDDGLKESSHVTSIDLAAPPLFDMHYLDYQNKKVTLDELAEFLCDYTSARSHALKRTPSVVETDTQLMKKAIIDTNPGIENKRDLKMSVRIPSKDSLLKPMSPDAEENPFRGMIDTK